MKLTTFGTLGASLALKKQSNLFFSLVGGENPRLLCLLQLIVYNNRVTVATNTYQSVTGIQEII